MQRLFLFLMLALLATSLAAQAETSKTEKAADAAKPAESQAPKPNPVKDWEKGGIKAETPLGQVSLGGYATFLHKTIGKINGGDSNNYFDAIRVVPQINWQITKWLEFAMEIEFEGGGFAPFLSDNEVLLEYAEARATFQDEFNIHAGLMLIPFGRYNKNHDDIFWDLGERPLVAQNIIPGGFDQPGLGFYGTFNQLRVLGISYDAMVTQGFKDGFDGEDGSDDVAFNSFREDNNDNKALWFRLGLTPEFGTLPVSADFGISYTYQSVGPGNTQALRGAGVDGAIKINVMPRFKIELTGEWDRLWIHRPSTVDSSNGLWGYFADLLFKFDPFPDAWKNDILGANPYLGLVFRVEQTDLNDDFKGTSGNDDRFAFTVGVSFRPISKLILRLEWKNQQSRNSDEGDENHFVISFSIGL